MELDAENRAGLIDNGGDPGIFRVADPGKSGRDLSEMIPMAHPHIDGVGQIVKQIFFIVDAEPRMPELPASRFIHLAFEQMAEELQSVTDAEHGDF